MRRNKGLAMVLAVSMALNLCGIGGISADAATIVSGQNQKAAVEKELQRNQENPENKLEEQWKKEKEERKEKKEKERKELSKLLKKGTSGRNQKKASDEEKVVASMSELILGDGSFTEAPAGSEISIESAKDLQALSEYTNAGKNTIGVTFTQTKDIDCMGATMAAIGSRWATGDVDEYGYTESVIYAFSGNYDGSGFKLSNLTICSQDNEMEYYTQYLGLFGYLSGATVKNVVVDSIEFKTFSEEESMSDICMSVIAGYIIDSVVENCENYADITLDTSFERLTGIVGRADITSTIKNCVNYGDFTAVYTETESDDEEYENWNDGIYGIVENIDGEISDCVNEGSITNYGNVCGIAGNGDYSVSKVLRCKNKGVLASLDSSVTGIISDHYGEVADCENSGNLESGYRVSGVGIYVKKVVNCTNTGDITAVSRAAGIIASSYSNVNIVNCTNLGKITGNVSGGIAAYAGNGVLTDCVNEGKVCADTLAGGILAEGYKITVNGCINKGNVESKDSAGGILGGMEDYEITGKCTVCNSKNFGKVSAEKNAGGIAGDVLGTQIVNVWNHGDVDGKQSAGGILGYVDFEKHFENYYDGYYYDDYYYDYYDDDYNYDDEPDEEEIEELKQSYLSGERQKDIVNTIGNSVNIGTVTSEKVAASIIGTSDIPNYVKCCYYQENSATKVCGSDDAATAALFQKDGWSNKAFIQELNQNISSLEMPMALMMEYDNEEGVIWKRGFVLEIQLEEYDYEDRIFGDVFQLLGLNYVLYDKDTKENIPLTPVGRAFVLSEAGAGEYEIHRIMSDGTYFHIGKDVVIEEECSLVSEKVYPSLFQMYSEMNYTKTEDGSYKMEMKQPFFVLAYEDDEEYSDVIIPEVMPVREGYTFGGWYRNPYVYSEELYEYYRTVKEKEFVKDIKSYEEIYEVISDYLDQTKEEYVSSCMNAEYGYDNLQDFTTNFDAYMEKAYKVKEFVTTRYDEYDDYEYKFLVSNFVYAKWIKNPEPQPTATAPAQTGTQSAIVYQQPDVNNYKETTGSYVKKSGVIYKVDTAKKTAKVTGVTSTQVKKVTIQATVKAAGVKCKVTSIGKKAFANCKKLKKITVKGKNLKTVHKTALKGVKKKVTIKANKKIKKLFKKVQKNR